MTDNLCEFGDSDEKNAVTLIMPSASKTGGAEEAFCQLVDSEAAGALKLQVIFLENGPLIDWTRPRVSEVGFIRCGRTRNVLKWWKSSGEILSLARDFNSKLILGWMTKGHVYGGLAGWRAGIPSAWFQMGIPENNILDRASRLIPTKKVLACSDFVAHLQRKAQTNADVVGVHLGVDVKRFQPMLEISAEEARVSVGLPLDCPVIGIVGRLQSWKGMHVLIQAMPAVLEKFPTAICIIVGGQYPAEPDYPERLRFLVKQLGIEKSVRMVGPKTDTPLWIRAMDIFVHASEREPFGIVVLEALYLGKTVIATVPGGPSEVISDGLNGYHVHYGDPLMLSKVILRILDMSAYIPSSTAHETAVRFSSEAFAEKTVKLLIDLARDRLG
jgi:glycosyltransferase involved in cell wall biosynthesis